MLLAAFFHPNGLLGHATAHALVLGLAHSIWIGGLLSLVLWIALWFMPAARARVRYLASATAMSLLVMGTIVAASDQWSGFPRPAPSRAAVAERVLQASPADPAGRDAPDEHPTRSADLSQRTAPPAGVALNSQLEPKSPPRGGGDQSWGWAEYLACAWLFVAAAMLLRLVTVVHGTRRLLHSARPLSDPTDAWLARLFEKLCRDVNIGSRVRILLCESIDVPAVCGALWPVILLPPSFVTGVSPEQLTVILVHELAHIQRWDYVVNVLQMIVEAILFFNPAVWWISRQMRAEREACCDLAVVRLTGKPLAVARALLDIAEWAQHAAIPPATLPAATGNGGWGPLGDRVRRLAMPGVRPRAILPWYSLAGLLLAGATLLAALLKGSDEIVLVAAQVAQKVMSPRERAEKLTNLERQFPSANGPGANSAGFSGWIRTVDGSPVPARTEIRWFLSSPVASGTSFIEGPTAPVAEFEFRREHVDPGILYVAAQARGFAPAFVGPLKLTANAHTPGIELVLTRGFEGHVRLTAQGGKPIVGAAIEGSYPISVESQSSVGSSFLSGRIKGRTTVYQFSRKLRSGPDGLIRVPRAVSWPMSFKTAVDGYQRSQVALTLKPNVTADWKLAPAEGSTGRIVSLETGRPIANAEILLADSDPREHLEWATRLATSSTDGTYRLATLESRQEYRALAHAAGFGWALVDRLRAGEKDRLIQLPPPLVVHGTIVGPLDQLVREWVGGRRAPSIQWRNPLTFPSLTDDSSYYAPVRIEGKVGHFELHNLVPGSLELVAGHRHIRRDITHSIPDLKIDLGASQSESGMARRQITVRFRGVRPDVPLKGQLEVSYQGEDRVYSPHEIDVAGPTAKLEVVAPNDLNFGRLAATGYWMAPKSVSLSQADSPQEITIDLLPSGAVHGRVIRANRSPCDHPELHILLVKRPAAAGAGWKRGGARITDDGQFLFPDLPLGGTYAVLALDDRPGSAAAVLSDDLFLDDAHPFAAATLKLPAGHISRIRVVGADSRPIPNADVFFDAWFTVAGRRVAEAPIVNREKTANGWISISLSNPPASVQVNRELISDREGIIAFRHGQERMENKWLVSVWPTGKNLGRQVVLDEKGELQLVRLATGVSAHGTALEASTGRPIPNAELRITPAGFPTPGIIAQQFAVTDLQGNFRFDALEPIAYRVSLSTATASAGQDPLLQGGAQHSVTLKLNVKRGAP